MTSLHLILLTIAIIIISALAAYAWYLTQKVKTFERQQQEEEAQAALQLRKHQEELVKDIQFVARSVVQEQCEITEGVLRIHYLLNGLDPDVWQHQELEAVRNHYLASKDMPILDAYKALTPKQQFDLDKERLSLEQQHKTQISRELNWLSNYQFPTVTLLQ